jgi:hypothetical protein
VVKTSIRVLREREILDINSQNYPAILVENSILALYFTGNYTNVSIGVTFTCLFINSNEQMVY